jgi:thiosulfate dehydrogenase [quinone] large subunit
MKNAILALRLVLGWLFVYAGYTKIIAVPAFSAAGYLNNATSFKGIYSWFASAQNIGWVSFLNEWGLLLIGLGLIFGFWTKYASMAGILLMFLYYFAVPNFPYVSHGFIVDDHIIYIIVFWLFIETNAGMYKGLDGRKVKA